MKQTVSGNIKCFDISCNDEDIEKSMNKPIILTIADIYLRFPEIDEDEANNLADFLEDEDIVYEGATDVFMEKDKEIERLKNIIYREISNYIQKKYGMLDDTHYHDFLNELELKESEK